MSISLTIGGTDYSAYTIGWVARPRSFAKGHGTWAAELDASKYLADTGGNLMGVFTGKKQAVVIGYDAVTYFNGYLENVIHLDAGPPNSIITRVSGRDYSQDLSNLIHTDSYGSSAKADDLLDDALSDTGSEITYTSPSTAPTVGGIEPREVSLLELFREVAERANYEGYVNSSKALQFFAIGTVSSLIVIASGDVLEAVYTELDEYDLRNTFNLYGARSILLPMDKDDWTEGTSEAKADTSTANPAYEELRAWTITPASGEYAWPSTMAVEYNCDGTADIRVGYQIGATGVVWPAGFEWLALNTGGGWSSLSVPSLMQVVTADANYNVSLAVYVYLQGRVVLAPTLSVRNLALTKQTATAYWSSSTSNGLSLDTSAIEGTYSVKYYVAAAASGAFAAHFDNTPQSLKISEYEYESLIFTCYAALTAGTMSYMDVRGYSSAGNYYYYRLFDLPLNVWQTKEIPLGVTAPWASSGSPDWNSVKWFEFVPTPSGATNITVYVDKLFLSGKRVTYSTQDNTSRTDYLPREWTEIIEDATLADITARGDSLKEKNKDPIAAITLVVPGSEGVVGGANKWLPGNNLQLDYTRLGISSGAADNYRMADIELVCYPKQNLHSGHSFIARLGLVAKTRKIQAERLAGVLEPQATRFGPS